MRISFVQVLLPVAMLLISTAWDAPRAQDNALFRPLPANAIANPTAEQSRVMAKLHEMPGADSIQLVQINIDALRNENITLNFSGQETVAAAGKPGGPQGGRDLNWIGQVAGTKGQVSLTVLNNAVTGSIQTAGGLYQITPLGNGIHALIKIDQGRVLPDHSQELRKGPQRMGMPEQNPRPNTVADDEMVTQKVLVAYTNLVGGDVNGFIASAIDLANASYANSGIHIRLVNSAVNVQVTYDEANKSFRTILNDLVSGAGSFAEIKRQRDLNEADMVVLLVNSTMGGKFCGEANVTDATAEEAYAIVSYQCPLGWYIFSHELGHLQGAGHDEADPDGVPFPYGRGYVQNLYPPSWRTMMAYSERCGGCARENYWSNPDEVHHWYFRNDDEIPLPSGDANHNNARVLNYTRQMVAGFRPVTPAHAEYCRVVSKTGQTYFSCGFARTSFSNEDRTTRQQGIDLGSRDLPVFLVDVNADGLADFCRFVTEPASGGPKPGLACALQTADGFGPAEIKSAPGIDPGDSAWPRFMADINGDKRADYCSMSNNTPWVGPFLLCALASETGFGSFEVRAVPYQTNNNKPQFLVDVDGDGKADFCSFRGGPGLQCTSLGFPTTFVLNSPSNFDPGTVDKPVMMADVDGDGRADYCRYLTAQPTVFACASAASSFATNIINEPAGHPDLPQFLVDVNGDRKADYCFLDDDETGPILSCALSTGSAFGPLTIRSWQGFDPGLANMRFLVPMAQPNVRGEATLR